MNRTDPVRRCPDCHGRPRQLEFEGRLEGVNGAKRLVTIDQCRSCSGFWFDSLEIEETVGFRADPTTLLTDAAPRCRECAAAQSPSNLASCGHCGRRAHLDCARCQASMMSVELLGAQVDLCMSCKGLFVGKPALRLIDDAWSERLKQSGVAPYASQRGGYCQRCGARRDAEELQSTPGGLYCSHCRDGQSYQTPLITDGIDGMDRRGEALPETGNNFADAFLTILSWFPDTDGEWWA